MEAQIWWLFVDVFPFPRWYFSGFMLLFGGVICNGSYTSNLQSETVCCLKKNLAINPHLTDSNPMRVMSTWLFQHVMVGVHSKFFYISQEVQADQTLPIGSNASFTWIILRTILCLVLDFQGFLFFCALATW